MDKRKETREEIQSCWYHRCCSTAGSLDLQNCLQPHCLQMRTRGKCHEHQGHQDQHTHEWHKRVELPVVRVYSTNDVTQYLSAHRHRNW